MALILQMEVTVQTLIFTMTKCSKSIYLMNTLNHYPLNFAFLRFPCAVF